MPWESQVFRVNNNLCNFSPDGRFIAIGCQCDITVKDVKNLETFHTYTFDDVLEVTFSNNSYNNHIVVCFSIMFSELFK